MKEVIATLSSFANVPKHVAGLNFNPRHGRRYVLSSSSLFTNVKIKLHRTIPLAVVLYGCESLSLMFVEGRRLKVFENRRLGRLFGSKMEQVLGGWRRLHNEELNELYS